VISLITSLNNLCGELGVIAHHHADPDEHDEETITTLRPLYDAVIEYTPDDGWVPVEHERTTTAPTFDTSTPPPGTRTKTALNWSEAVPMRYSFDTLIELVSSPRRRTLLYNLKSRSADEVSLDQLVEEVHNIDRSLPIRDAPSRENVRTELVHVHLPMLRDAGIVRYDRDSETIRYTANQGLEAFLRYLETIEIG
jgi:DNA-binding transcriptional ArsR family regulator